MKYSEWLENNKEDAARVIEFKSFGDDIRDEDGMLDVEKIMNMSIMMVMNTPNGISITLC